VSAAPRPQLAEVIARHRVLVCVGTGGVGKTTMAAALGLSGALAGRRAMVLTIDPARQLARALGLRRLASGGEPIPRQILEQAGLSPRGTLHAAMLDQKSAWDAFVRRHAPDARTRRALLQNPFYAQLSTTMAGSTEYMAVEELCQLEDSGRFDLLVIDTPPATHAVDFLRAPRRIEQLFDPEVARWLSTPYAELGRNAFGALTATVELVVRQLQRVAGTRTLEEISAFFGALGTLLGDVAGRARRARELLQGDRTAFVLVAGPTEQVLSEGEVLLDAMGALGIELKASIVNRVHPAPGATEDAVAPLLGRLRARGVRGPELAWIETCIRDGLAVHRAERERLSTFRAGLPAEVAWAEAAELEHDAHCLADLARIASLLSTGDGDSC
jgi:anion-transporting  ArsA/GET3 family ATPase